MADESSWTRTPPRTPAPVEVGDRVAVTYLSDVPIIGTVTEIAVMAKVADDSGDWRWFPVDRVALMPKPATP